MNLITPERVPVTVYRWDDANAPVLDKTPNCVASIFKACLVTGYGSKQPAGWSMPYEDMTNNIKVFRPSASANKDYYLHVSADTGKQANVKMMADMTDINTGTLLLQCDTPYMYNTGDGGGAATGKWVLIASKRGLWFFTEVNGVSRQTIPNKQGLYFYCGDTCSDNSDAKNLCLTHSGGTIANHYDRYGFMRGVNKTDMANPVKIYDVATSISYNANQMALFSGQDNVSNDIYVGQIALTYNSKICLMPAFTPSNNSKNNYTVVSNGGRMFINHATGNFYDTYYNYVTDNFYVATDYWEM